MKQFHANPAGILEIPLLLMPKSSPFFVLGQTYHYPVRPSAHCSNVHVAATRKKLVEYIRYCSIGAVVSQIVRIEKQASQFVIWKSQPKSGDDLL